MSRKKLFSEMSKDELLQRLYSMNGIIPPKANATRKEWDDYSRACFLTLGMKIYKDKQKAEIFMHEKINQFSRDKNIRPLIGTKDVYT